MINTNHYHTDAMCKVEVPRGAVYEGAGVPREWLGTRVHLSSEMRFDRASELLAGKARVDEEKIVSVLRDHGGGSPSNLTICQHGPLFSTVRSVVFYPERHRMRVLIGNTCEGEYTDLKFT